MQEPTGFAADYVVFGTYKNDYYCFNNQYPCYIFEDDLIFTNINHYLAYHRAVKLKDQEKIKEMAECRSPSIIKKYITDWNDDGYETLKNGLELKFKQNPHLAQILIDTNDKKILYVNNRDSYLGTGTLTKFIINGKKAKGQNILGILLMKIREEAHIWL